MPRRSKNSTAPKQSANRRVSASTTAPTAPRDSSSHMNQNRSWPGVPNRYSTRFLSGKERRPKSIATVVVDFASTPLTLSVSTLAAVSVSSVVSGSISLTEPTNVVLPTPKPPAIRILTWMGNKSDKPSEAINHRLQNGRIVGVLARCELRDHHTEFDQVGQHDRGDGHRPPQHTGYLRHRGGFFAQFQRFRMLDPQLARCDHTPARRSNHRNQVERRAGLGSAAGHGVRPHAEETGVLVRTGHRHLVPLAWCVA